MAYTNFDRHANMDSETRRAILDLIHDAEMLRYQLTRFDGPGINTEDSDILHSFVNSLFGLFDGYLYDSLFLEIATYLKHKKRGLDEIGTSFEEASSITTTLYNQVSNYPKC